MRGMNLNAEEDAGPGSSTRTPMQGDDAIDFTIIELLFFAYRDFTSDPDQILAEYGFGRAHHRVLHFVNRKPGMTVAELLEVLRITKQSLARVLKQLIDAGHVVQRQGARDRRQRRLYPTQKGRALAMALAVPQSRRIARALEELGPAGRAVVERFLEQMVDPELRSQIDVVHGPEGDGNPRDDEELSGTGTREAAGKEDKDAWNAKAAG
jgi:DNA-binding MarR family transcriptional regulator